MTEQFVIKAIYITLLISGPILLVTLLIGLGIGIFQAVTSINEMTLTFIPKMLVVIILLLVMLPWILNYLQNYLINVFNLIPLITR